MTKKMLEYYLALRYRIELTPDKDGYWFASIPLLKGCIRQGERREDAFAEGMAIDETAFVPSEMFRSNEWEYLRCSTSLHIFFGGWWHF